MGETNVIQFPRSQERREFQKEEMIKMLCIAEGSKSLFPIRSSLLPMREGKTGGRRGDLSMRG